MSASPSDPPLHVETVGEGPPLVLLHGFAASAFTWRLWAPELARRHTLHLVDLKGFGSSPSPPDRAYGARDQAELVARLVVERGMEGVTLVGHSMGGGISLLTTLLLRDRGEGHRIRRLVSVAGTAYEQPMPPFVGLARRRTLARLLLWALPTRWLVRTVIRSVVHDPDAVTEEQVRGYAEPLRDPGTRHALLETATAILPPDLDRWTARYPELDLPTLLLWGDGDRVVPRSVADRLADDLPDARLVVLPACGHIPPEERPRESRAALEAFLDATSGAVGRTQ